MPLVLLAIVTAVKMIYVADIMPEQRSELIKNKMMLSLDDLRAKLQLSDQEADVQASSSKWLVSNQELLERMSAQLASRSVEQVASYIENNQIPLEQRVELLRIIIANDAYGFSHDDAVQLVLDVANTYAPGSQEQKRVFSLLLEYYDLLKKSHPLFIAVEHGYKAVILPLLAWAIKIAPEHPEIKKDLEELKYRALLRAVNEENVKALRAMHAFESVSQEHANDLLWHIAQSGKSAFLLPELKKIGADIDQVRNKMTPLIQAVQKGNLDVVNELIALDVNLDKIADIEFGTALQRAIANRNVDIERILRRAGARE